MTWPDRNFDENFDQIFGRGRKVAVSVWATAATSLQIACREERYQILDTCHTAEQRYPNSGRDMPEHVQNCDFHQNRSESRKWRFEAAEMSFLSERHYLYWLFCSICLLFSLVLWAELICCLNLSPLPRNQGRYRTGSVFTSRRCCCSILRLHCSCSAWKRVRISRLSRETARL